MSISPPTTPPSRAPTWRDWRFHRLPLFTEWVEDYHPGGFHPVILGDIFHDGQYKVIRKLNYEDYSTIWLARDLRNNIYVTMKIMVSQIPGSINESQILRHLIQVAPEGTKHIAQLIDEFEHRGPNGVHKCLIFEPMGPDLDRVIREFPQPKPRQGDLYPYWMAKSILKQSLQSLVFLHENGIAHGDLRPRKMMFVLNDINSKSEDELRQKEDTQDESITAPVQRLDGKQDKWAPPYLCYPQWLLYPSDYAEGFKIKLCDMGSAYFFDEPPTKPLTSAALRPPELILFGAVDESLDIWGFGCLIFELVTGHPLFDIKSDLTSPRHPTEANRDDDHLLYMDAFLGALPDHLYKHWKRSWRHFTSERELYDGISEWPPGQESGLSMEEQIDQARPEIDEEEARKVKAIVRRILQYDPNQRPSAAELLNDPFFENELGSTSS